MTINDKFTLVIKRSPIWSSFKYWVYLYIDGIKIADSPVDTKWGAKRWAKRIKREYLSRLGTDGVIERIEI